MQKSCLHSNIRSSFLTLCGWLLLYFNSSVGPFKKITWKKFSFIIAARKALEKSFLPHFPSFSYFRQHVLAINHWKWGSAQRGKIWEMFFTPWIYQKLCCLFIFCHLIWFGVRNDTVMDLPTHCYYYCEVCVCVPLLWLSKYLKPCKCEGLMALFSSWKTAMLQFLPITLITPRQIRPLYKIL